MPARTSKKIAAARSTAIGLAMMLVLAACASASPTATTVEASTAGTTEAPGTEITVQGSGEPIVIFNEGGVLEGHTPRGFAGTGAGLFVGDNLNPGFPDGDGVQTYMTFELQGPVPQGSAELASDVLNVRGNPFEDLGPLVVELVEYDAFGPELFDLVAVSPSVPCRLVEDSGVACDVTSLIDQARGDNATKIQFRLKFTEAGDSDGEADLAMFFVQDSNTNESGLFRLTLGG